MAQEEIINLDDTYEENSDNSYDVAAVEQSDEPTTIAENSNEDYSDEVENNSNNNSTIVKKKSRQYSDLEKAQYSFKKQFARQRSKYEQEIANFKSEFEQKLTDEIDKVKNPAKYAPKTRADFEYDDDYVKYLTDERVNAALEAKMLEFQRQQELEQNQFAIESEYKKVIAKNLKSNFPTPEQQTEWTKKVTASVNKGLGTLLDDDPDLAQYIVLSPVGPKILLELATNKKALADVFTLGVAPNGKARQRTPTDRMRKIEELADRLRRNNNNKRTTSSIRPIGKPGITKNVKKSIFDDKKALLDMMYS